MTKTILVPVEPSEEMVSAAYAVAHDPIWSTVVRHVWAAMLRAAPKPIPADDVREDVIRAIDAAEVEFGGHSYQLRDMPASEEVFSALIVAAGDAAISTLQGLGWGKK